MMFLVLFFKVYWLLVFIFIKLLVFFYLIKIIFRKMVSVFFYCAHWYTGLDSEFFKNEYKNVKKQIPVAFFIFKLNLLVTVVYKMYFDWCVGLWAVKLIKFLVRIAVYNFEPSNIMLIKFCLIWIFIIYIVLYTESFIEKLKIIQSKIIKDKVLLRFILFLFFFVFLILSGYITLFIQVFLDFKCYDQIHILNTNEKHISEIIEFMIADGDQTEEIIEETAVDNIELELKRYKNRVFDRIYCIC